MNYATLTEASRFYNSSKQNIRQRGIKGSIPTTVINGKTAYLVHDDYKLTFSSKGEKRGRKPRTFSIDEQELQAISKMETTEKPVVKKNLTTMPTIAKNAQVEEEDEVEETTYKVAQPRESLFTNPELVENALSTRMTITDSDRECIEMFCEHYRDYLLYYRLATAEPIVKGFVNPYFKLSRDQWLIVKELSAQLGIGIKNRLKLKVEEPKSVNPFEELMK